MEKGFISYVLLGGIKEYKALDPKIIEKYIDSKKTEFRKILPELKKIRFKYEFSSAEVYEGYKGILNAMLAMTSNAKKGEIYKYFAASPEVLSEQAIMFFSKADLIRGEKGLKIRGIANISNKKKLGDYGYSKVKYTNQEIPPAMNIFRDYVLILSLSKNPSAVLIKSKEISRQYHQLWDSVWKSAGKNVLEK